MFCNKCGTQIKSGEGFCTGCGRKIEKDEFGKVCKLIVTREKKVMGFAITFPVFVDGVELGKLGNGKSLETDVLVGKHTVEFRCVEKTISQDVELKEDNNSVEVVCRADMGLIAAVAHVTKVEYK